MATCGQVWEYDKAKIAQSLKNSKGRITVACKELSVQYETLKKVIDKEPDLALLLKNLRQNFEHTILDMAENCIAVAMNTQEDDPNNAIKAAMYTLNSRGMSRGWSNTLVDVQKAPSIVDLENIKMENEALKAKLNDIQNKPETEPELPGSDTQV